VLFHAIIAEERGAFTIEDVSGSLVAKMEKRHPWLYGRETTEKQQTDNRETTDGLADDSKREPWEQMKARSRKSLAEGLPQGLPSLHRAHRLQERAAGVGFDWPDAAGPSEKVREELGEVAEIIARDGYDFPTHGVPSADPRHAALEHELGDLLFAVVNLCRKCGVHPALALDKANAKFQRRFEAIEQKCETRGVDVRTAGLTVLDAMWDEVKREE
jgi:MazG family protein